MSDLSELKHLPTTDYAPAELDEASKTLLRAADYIEKHGWCQNSMTDYRGRVCLVGAIQAVAGEVPCAAWDRIQDELGGMAGRWNDKPTRTQAEVVAKLRAVAMGQTA